MPTPIKRIHLIATSGAVTSNGGTVIAKPSGITLDGLPVATVGDLVKCPIHGDTTIVDGCGSTMEIDGRPVALVGSRTSSGAMITRSPQRQAAIVEYADGTRASVWLEDEDRTLVKEQYLG